VATSKIDILDFLAQKSNLAGSAVAIITMLGGGIFLDLTAFPVLGLGAAGYVAGFLIFGEPKQSINLVQASDAVELKTIQANISKLRMDIDQHSKRIPDEIMAASESIFEILEEIIPRWKELSSFAEQKYTINAVITEYFPDTITNYMNLPKSYYRNGAKNRVAEEIVEQLGILRKALEEIRDSLYEGVETDIKVQSQFLRDKFVANETGRLNLN
jgi:dsDNA-specific endonuclease/ATPase MutS2